MTTPQETLSRPHVNSSGRWPALDGLRGIAVLMVLVDHGGLGIVGRPIGAMGVTIFFVLSGFLITHVIMTARARGEWSMPRFLMDRMVRLLPALLVMQLVVAACWFLTRGEWGDVLKEIASATFYVQNFFYHQFETDLLAHAWSLATEEQFYLIWPLLLPWLLRCRRPLPWMALLIVASMLARLLLATEGHEDLAFASLPANACALLLGCLLAVDPAKVKSGRVQQTVPVLGLVAIAAGALLMDAPALYIVLPILAAPLAMIVVMVALPGVPLLEVRWLRFTGRISYALYLWHWPVLVLADERYAGRSALPWLGLSLVLAIASTLLIEEPLRRAWRTRVKAARLRSSD